MEQLKQAIEELRLSAIVYAPDLPPAQVRELAGDRALVLDQPANLRAVLQDCDLVVTHGNHGVVSEALLAGKPVLNFPLVLEQFLNARLVERLAAGLIGDPQVPESLVPLLQRALNDSRLTAGAGAFADRYKALDGATQAQRLAARLASLC